MKSIKFWLMLGLFGKRHIAKVQKQVDDMKVMGI